MSMQLHLPAQTQFHATRPARQRFDENVSDGFHSFSLETSIQTDVRRLFHALTVPEYVEVWIAIPGEMPGCSTVAARSDDDFAIEHFCDGKASVMISGRYRAPRRRNVAFSWRVEGDLCFPQTEVEIHLRGDFERTTLTLRHAGFTSRHDFAWHRALWTASIERLAALYDASDRRAVDVLRIR